MVKVYRKLVRDKIPEIIAVKGEKAKVRTLTDEEFTRALAAKLVEEAREVGKATGDRAELAKEIGDVLEVIDVLVAHEGLNRHEIERVKAERKAKRGGFEKKIMLESVA